LLLIISNLILVSLCVFLPRFLRFTDWDNWNFSSPSAEFELFDLDADEWEQHNIYKQAAAGSANSSVSTAALIRLKERLEMLYRCAGVNCN
jgi:hypothetical protein